MIQKYYLSFFKKYFFIFAIVFIISIPVETIVFFYITGELASLFFMSSFAISLILALFIRIIGIELSEHGMRINPLIWISDPSVKSPKVKYFFVQWDQIQGMIIFDYSYGRQKTKIYRILFKKPDGSLTSLALNPSIVENSNELFDNLRKKIPNIMQNHQIFSAFLKNFISPSRIQYKKLTLTEEGIIHPKGIISWNNLKVVYYDDFFSRISGYGAINITFQNQKDYIDSIKIVPQGTEKFRKFLRYLISKAYNASVDPSLLKIFESSYNKERAVIKWFVIILIIVLVFFFGYFIYGVFFKYPMP